MNGAFLIAGLGLAASFIIYNLFEKEDKTDVRRKSDNTDDRRNIHNSSASKIISSTVQYPSAVRTPSIVRARSAVSDHQLDLKDVPVTFKLSASHQQRVCNQQQCHKKSKVMCARCINKFYCNKKHQKEDWIYGHAACSNHLSKLASDVGFSVNRMHVQLRSQRGSTVDPYTCWGMNASARFHCGNCKHTWTSAKAFVEINLRRLVVIRTYSECCRHCNQTAQPEFENIEYDLKRLFIWLKELDGTEHRFRDDNVELSDPHRADLCEKCGFGANPCRH